MTGNSCFDCKANLNIENQDCVCAGVCACVSLKSDASETVEVTIVKLGKVTASDMRMHHILIILTLTFIQGHTALNHENNTCLIISETI